MATQWRTRAQGSTEYLVILAVVLVIALVAIALLGFFPGMSLEAKVTQSYEYWTTARPIAISEMAVKYDGSYWPSSAIYLFFKNTGTDPVRITKIFVGSQNLTKFGTLALYTNFSDAIYLEPGDQIAIGDNNTWGGAIDRHIHINPTSPGACNDPDTICGIQSACRTDGTGVLVLPDFGFEYIEYIGGQAITKKEIGTAPLMIKCGGRA